MNELGSSILMESIQDRSGQELPSGYGYYLLEEAFDAGCSQAVELFLNKVEPMCDPVLHITARCGNEGHLEKATLRANSSHKTDSYIFYIDWRKIPNAKNKCEILLKHGFDVNHIWDGYTYSPLYNAVSRQKEDVVEVMLLYGANPIMKCRGNNDRWWTPLKKALFLLLPNIKMIIKFAALHVDTANERELKEFLAHFKSRKAKAYFKFAKRCLEEVSALKEINLNCDNDNLYQFIMSAGEQLTVLQNDTEIKRNLLSILLSTSLPIYESVIEKKLEKKSVLDVLCGLSDLKWSAKSDDIYLNNLCVKNIFSFLCKSDLLNLWKAIH